MKKIVQNSCSYFSRCHVGEGCTKKLNGVFTNKFNIIWIWIRHG